MTINHYEIGCDRNQDCVNGGTALLCADSNIDTPIRSI